MGRVFGENFPVFVDQQIKQRQNFNAQNKRFTSSDKYSLDMKQSFMRLISGVNIFDDKIISNTGVSGVGQSNDLARKFILFNGVSDINNTSISGINSTNNLAVNTLKPRYGWGDINDGYRPLPFMESIQITSKNNGSLREATVKIKAFNQTQFKVIELLYLRLGYTMLLEWGNTTFLDNSANQRYYYDFSNSSPKYKFLQGKIDIKTMHQVVREQSRKCSGNYDGFVGKVVNFSWSFLPDATYDITLDLITYGDVIESLNLNLLGGVSTGIKNTSSEKEGEEQEDEITIFNQANQNNLGFYFFQLFSIIQLKLLNQQLSGGLAENNIFTVLYDYFQGNSKITNFKKDFLFLVKKNLSSLPDINESSYIRLGSLLELIQSGKINNISENFAVASSIPYIINKSTQTEIPEVELDYDQNTNLCMFRPNLFSTNPYVCLIGGYETLAGKKLYFSNNQYQVYSFRCNPDDLSDNEFTSSRGKYGKTMNIYINVLRFLQIIQEKKNEEGKSSLYDVLNELCLEINVSLCNVTSLEPRYDEINNRLEIVDNNFIQNCSHDLNIKKQLREKINTLESVSEEYADSPTEIRIYGGFGSKDQATIVRTFDLKTELTKEIASTISIGAQAAEDSNSPDPTSTAFLTFNKGLKDRISPQRIHKTNKQTQDQAESTVKENKQEIYTKLEEILEIISSNDGTEDYEFPDRDDISSWENALRGFFDIQDKENKSNQNKVNQSAGIIPINLSITLDGIAGIKLFQTVNINKEYLPAGYKDVKFLIKGLNHSIQNNDWTTTLETIMAPYSDAENVYESDVALLKGISSTTNQNTTDRSTDCPILPDLVMYKKTDEEMLNIGQTVFSELNKEAVSAILGFLYGESKFNSSAYNSTGGGCGAYGLSQWRGDRQKGLIDFCSSNQLDAKEHINQLKYVKYELKNKGNFKRVWNVLQRKDLTVLQYLSCMHLTYGFKPSISPSQISENMLIKNTYYDYKKINDIKDWKKIYLNFNGQYPDNLQPRLTKAEQLFNI